MDAGSNTIQNNTIADTYQGIDICGPSFNTVESNTIGTNASHLPDFGVGNQGISTFDGACLSGGGSNGAGRVNHIFGNFVANSQLNGIAVDSIQNTVLGNTVTNTLGGAAIETSSSGNIVGGNSVHNNLHDGVQVDGGDADQILQNSIDSNGGKGIALINGGNHGQSFPVLASAALTLNGSVRIKGTLTSNSPNGSRIEYFASPTCDPSGFGEGATFIGFSTQQAGAGGVVTIDTGSGLSAPVAPGEAITATATIDFEESTSEFSACVTATDVAQSSP